MFLLVSVRHVGAHPDGHQHGVSIQISINLGKLFLRISRIYELFLRPKSWLGSLYIYVFTFPRFWTSSIQWFWFWFWSILSRVTLKTSNFIIFYHVFLCFPVFSPVFLCFPLFSSVFPCFLLFSPVFLRFPMFPYVFPCFLLLPVLPFLSMFSHVSLRFLLISYVFLCFPLFYYVSPFFSVVPVFLCFPCLLVFVCFSFPKFSPVVSSVVQFHQNSSFSWMTICD